MKLIILAFLFALTFAVIACSSKKDQRGAMQSQKKSRIAKDTLEKFQTFNIQFHNDYAFQVSRVAFPIGGKYVDGESQHKWTKQNWRLQKNPVGCDIDTTKYKYLLTKTDTSVIEKFWINQSGFTIERRFKLKNNKWYLTYFNDVNL